MNGKCISIIEDGIGIITIDSPPVNALSHAVRRGLDDAFRRFGDDDAVRAMVLICAGRTFCAGADLTERETANAEPSFPLLMEFIENGPKPVIAAIHGTALGGGYELALICHYRIATSSAKVGLPEVNVGLMPGGGGALLLPRIVGVETALDLLTSGRHVPAAEALALGMIDALAGEDTLRKDAIAFARRVIDEQQTPKRVRDRNEKLMAARGHPEIFETFLDSRREAFRGLKAPVNIVKAVQAAVEADSFEAARARQLELFSELWNGTEAAARRYYFLAERAAARRPEAAVPVPILPVRSVGMTGSHAFGLAKRFIDAGIPVMTSAGDDHARDIEALRAADLIIAADADEDSAGLLRRLDAVARPDAILATSSLSLDLDAFAGAAAHGDRVVGFHLSSAANPGRLLELVTSGHTAPDVVATLLKLGKTIGLVPVTSGLARGSIVERMTRRLYRESDALARDGVSPSVIDQAIYGFGFPIGPFQLRGDSAPPGAAERKMMPEAIIARLLHPLVDEGATILAEKSAIRASDIDVACVLGLGWPVQTGGPMFWGDTVGLSNIVASLDNFGPASAAGEALRAMAMIVRRKPNNIG